MKIKTKDLMVAELRYFNAEAKGLEVVGDVPYVIVQQQGNHYVNVLCPSERYPALIRAKEQNYVDGEYYGTKVAPIRGVATPVESGPCFLICNKCGLDSELPEKEEVEISDIEDYILCSSRFFKDRSSIASRKVVEGTDVDKMAIILANDLEKVVATEVFFAERNCSIGKVKIK